MSTGEQATEPAGLELERAFASISTTGRTELLAKPSDSMAPTLASAGLSTATRSGSTSPSPLRLRDARSVLANRVLLVAGDDAEQYCDLLDFAESGLVVGGKQAGTRIKSLHAAFPDLVLVVDPWQSQDFFATPTRPFILDDGGDEPAFFSCTLEDVLNGQINMGASVAVTPTGFFQAGDTDSLKAAVLELNALRRDDVVLLVPLSTAWFTAGNLRHLVAILGKSEHPVALALGDPDRDPHGEVLPGLRQLVGSLSWSMCWRTDMAGFDAMAHGARAASIGTIPSKRAASVPETIRRAINKRDRNPHVLYRPLLRYVRTRYMQDEWFAATNAPGCPCRVCGGRDIDRYSGTEASQLEAHRHNVAIIMEMLNDMNSHLSPSVWWRASVIDAVANHVTLGGQIGRPIKVPKSVQAFATP